MSHAKVFDHDADRAAIAEVVSAFFGAFTSGPDVSARLDGLRELFLPEARIVRTSEGRSAVFDVDAFIAPRLAMLTDGTLTEFREWPTSGRTDVYGDVAQHRCGYAKRGVQDGQPFTGRGRKTLELVRTDAGWRISAVAWEDEPV